MMAHLQEGLFKHVMMHHRLNYIMNYKNEGFTHDIKIRVYLSIELNN
jgi:hypothetical protein